MDQATQGTLRTKRKASASASPAKAAAKPMDPLGGIQTRPADQSELRSRQILAAMMSFAGGEFGTRLPLDWTGTDARIAEAFNQTISNAERITTEAARLSSTVGKEGRLSQRMSAPGAVGGWAAQVDSLNTLMDDLVRGIL